MRIIKSVILGTFLFLGAPLHLNAYQLINDFVSPIGGSSATSAVTMATCNMLPFGKPTQQDLNAINTAATNEMNAGFQKFQSMSLYNCDGDLTCKGDTRLALLLSDKNQNYITAGFEQTFLAAVQNLKSAIAKFAYLNTQGYATAMDSLKKAVRYLAGVYLTIADEFLIDALHLRFNSTTLSVDTCIQQQIEGIDSSLKYYLMGSADFMDICLQPVVGTQKVIGSSFSEDEWHFFNVMFDRISMAYREKGAKQRALGSNTDDAIKQSLSESISALYLQAVALGNQLGSTFLDSTGKQLLTSIATVSRQLGDYRAGLNPLGYDERYVPLIKFEDMLQMALDLQYICSQKEADIRNEVRTFDQKVSDYKIQMTYLDGNYKSRAGELTGCSTSLSDTDFRTCADSSGNALFVDCPMELSPEEFDKCLKAKGSLGVIGDKYRQVKSSDLSLSQAKLQYENYGKEIENHNASTNYQIQILKDENSAVIEALKSYQDKLKNACNIEDTYRVIKEKGKSTQRIHTTNKTFSVKNSNLIAETAREIDMRQATLNYQIRNAQDPVVVKNLLLRQSEALIAIDIAVNSKNAMIASFDASLREKENLLVLWDQNVTALNHYSMSGEAVQRILSSEKVVDLSKKLNQLSHYSYLAAKALEYRYAKPLPEMQIGTPLDLNELYKSQSSNDFQTFLNDLKDYNKMRLSEIGAFNPYRYYFSVTKNVLGLTDKYLGDNNGDGLVDATKRAVTDVRYEKFQEYLNQQMDENGNLTFTFRTSVNEFPLVNTRENIKIWQGDIPGYTGNFIAMGLTSNLDFRGNPGTIRHKMNIVQSGAHSLLMSSKTNEYYPISTLALYNGDTSALMNGGYGVTKFTDFIYPFVSTNLQTPGSSGSNGSWSIKFANKSAVVEQWTITLEKLSADPNNIPDFPFNKLSDIIFYFDAIGE